VPVVGAVLIRRAVAVGRRGGTVIARSLGGPLRVDLAEHCPDLGGLVGFDKHLRQDPGRRRGDVRVDLVGRDLDQRLVQRNRLPHLLVPCQNDPLGHGLAHGRHHDLNGGLRRCHRSVTL
jgi:hypothetical protein